jgi:hypothetical protein
MMGAAGGERMPRPFSLKYYHIPLFYATLAPKPLAVYTIKAIDLIVRLFADSKFRRYLLC